ncbi:MAG TPA: threonine ammonia-lyase [Hypericibacter adhaerens]|uniref:L-serine dehydratase n=1 Tax=Hypericibacter adhaerens TaxID=2602016 RepID=A0A5J6MZS3_9PROT|nr:threonine ammonia-lyase [Hypericibacter adhaerens]QEX21810.1 threonine ammonia-lyase [Hypericibacter adhaerens]HWA46183.1 threonine ammonia-lyase [Hypericibacter adhaerens]
MSVTIDQIREAASVIAGHVVRTPAVETPRLAETTGCARLVLKLESQQFTGSFKDRGAYNKLKSLTPAEAKAGVIAMSAGNHAQGVAYHAQRLGIPATIVMPKGTPFTKVERTAAFGARVMLEGDGIDSAAVFARELAQREGLIFVHPYDDPRIIAGQGTIGLELAEDCPDLDMVVVPIGGGGLIGGIATALKALRPSIEIVGVEAALYPSMFEAVRGSNKPLAGGATIAEGIAVKSPGHLTKAIIKELVSDILLVDEDAVERAIQLLVESQKLVAEGAGAAGLAAILAHGARFKGRKVGTVICGGNIDARLLSQVLMRGLVRDGRVITLRIEITDQPGVLAAVARAIGDCGGNIIEIHHQRMFYDLPVKRADVDAVIETRNPQHVRDIVSKLEAAGFPCRLLSSRSIESPH